MGIRKLISAFAALALAASSLGAMAITASAATGDVTTVLDEAFTSGSVTDPDDGSYAWGTGLNLSTSGLLLTNGNSTSGNYTDTTLVTFTNAVGSTTNSVGISYDVAAQGTNVSKGQAYTYFTMSYYDASDNLILSLSEDVGKWANTSTLTYKDSATTTATATLSTHIAGSVSATITYTSGGGIIAIGGNSYSFVSAAGISKVTLSVSGGQDYSRGIYVKNYKLTTTEMEAASSTTYKVVKKCGDTQLSSETKDGVVGATVAATADDMADFVQDGVKYSYDSTSSTSSITLGETADDNVITLYFDSHAAVSIPVTATADGTTISSDTVDSYVGYAYSYGPYAYIEKDGVYYKYDGIQEDGSVPSITGTTATNSAISLAYTKADAVVYYAEVSASNYIGHNPYSTGEADTNASGGANGGATYSSDGSGATQSFSVDVAGTYKITVNATSGAGSKTRTNYVTVDSTSRDDSSATLIASASPVVASFKTSLTAGDHTLYYLAANDSGVGPYIDYMVVELVSADETTEDKGYTFDDLKVSDVSDKTLKVSGTDSGKGAFSGEKAVSELISGTSDFSDDTNLVFGLIISDVPETATITSIVIE